MARHEKLLERLSQVEMSFAARLMEMLELRLSGESGGWFMYRHQFPSGTRYRTDGDAEMERMETEARRLREKLEEPPGEGPVAVLDELLSQIRSAKAISDEVPLMRRAVERLRAICEPGL